jgi:pyrroloquinoline quinone (PQQ) biosynthesis protein C
MLKCDEVAAQASDFLDQEMTFSQKAAFRLHLLYCSNCRRFVRQLGLLKQSVQLRQVKPAHQDQIDTWLKAVEKKKSSDQ